MPNELGEDYYDDIGTRLTNAGWKFYQVAEERGEVVVTYVRRVDGEVVDNVVMRRSDGSTARIAAVFEMEERTLGPAHRS